MWYVSNYIWGEKSQKKELMYNTNIYVRKKIPEDA